jgi:hypothetical protein
MRNCERDLKKGFERNRKGNVKRDLYPSKRTLCSSKQTKIHQEMSKETIIDQKATYIPQKDLHSLENVK